MTDDDFLAQAIANLTARLDDHEQAEMELFRDMGKKILEMYQGWPSVYGAAINRDAKANELERRVRRVETRLLGNGEPYRPKLESIDDMGEHTQNGEHVVFTKSEAEALKYGARVGLLAWRRWAIPAALAVVTIVAHAFMLLGH